MNACLLDDAPLYRDRDASGPIVLQLSAGQVVQAGRSSRHKGADWTEVALDSGQKGFVTGARLSEEAALDQDQADLYAAAKADAAVKGRIAKNDRLFVLGVAGADEPGPGWCLVRHAVLGDGYLAGSVRVRPAEVPELTYGRSFLGGAKIIGGLALIGAAYLVLRSEIWPAIALVAICFISGGVGGLVFFATRGWRESEFGPHLSWGAVLAGYLATVGLLLLLVGWLSTAAAPVHPGVLIDPVFGSMLLGVGIVAALFLGYHEQRVQHEDEGRPWRVPHLLVPLLGGVALLLFGGGGLWWARAEAERFRAVEARTPPQEISLRDLQLKGYDDNRYLLLTDFRYADKWIVEEVTRDAPRQIHGWVILAPDRGKRIGELARTPSAATAVLVRREILPAGAEDPTPGLQRFVRGPLSPIALFERVMVLNGTTQLPPAVRQSLLEAAPDTRLDQVWILSPDVEPIAQEEWETRRLSALLAAGGGLTLLALVLLWARSGRCLSPNEKPGVAAANKV